MKQAVADGIIDIDTLQQQVELNKRRKYLESHKYKIWQGSNGFWYTYLKGRKLVKKKNKEDLEELVIREVKRESAYSMEDLFYLWLNKKYEYGEICKQTYDRYVCDFKKYYENTKQLKVEFITEDRLEDIVKTAIRDYEMTSKGWTNYKIILKGIFKHAKKLKCTEISITNFLGDLEISKKTLRRNVKDDKSEVFTREEIKRIKEHIRTYDRKETQVLDLGILLAMYTGLRVGELSALKYSDYKDGKLSVSRMEVHYKDEDSGSETKEVQEHTKTDAGTREIILTAEAIDIIEKLHRLNPFGEYLLMKDGKRIRAYRYTVRLKKICEQIGIKPRTMHKLRKTYGTNLLNGNVDEKLVQSQMGHSSIAVTQQYYYYNDKDDATAKRQISSAINY
ncbi:MAG: site-specific integrase [Eubacterium sp.]|nr:site-specific integrase [Eubacterium sp.]